MAELLSDIAIKTARPLEIGMLMVLTGKSFLVVLG